MAEVFDDDPFSILAWRGREREDLLANLRAARADGPHPADWAEQAGTPLAACLDTYFARRAEIPATAPPTSSSTALLDQLPPLDVTIRGRSLPDLLRPAFAALGAIAPPGTPSR